MQGLKLMAIARRSHCNVTFPNLMPACRHFAQSHDIECLGWEMLLRYLNSCNEESKRWKKSLLLPSGRNPSES